MENYIIFGDPGAGKDTVVTALCNAYRAEEVATGRIFRCFETDPEFDAFPAFEKTHYLFELQLEFREKFLGFLKRQAFIPDDFTMKVINAILANSKKPKVFNGFPRTIEQAKRLAIALKDKRQKINALIELRVTPEELLRRLKKRNRAGGDDTLENVKTRMADAQSKTQPVRYLLEGMGVPCAWVQAPTISEGADNLETEEQESMAFVQEQVNMLFMFADAAAKNK